MMGLLRGLFLTRHVLAALVLCYVALFFLFGSHLRRLLDVTLSFALRLWDTSGACRELAGQSSTELAAFSFVDGLFLCAYWLNLDLAT